mgnify:CR=1 FL=1
MTPGLAAQAPALAPHQQLAHDIYKQLIEINTTDSVGSTTVAAEAMAHAGLDTDRVALRTILSQAGETTARVRLKNWSPQPRTWAATGFISWK